MEMKDLIRIKVKNLIDSGMHFNMATAATDIAKSIGLEEKLIDEVHIELRNAMYEEAYKKIPIKERYLFLPHCSRNSKLCKAEQDETGYHCKHCGQCELTKAVKLAEKLGYKNIFIVPGGTMIKNIVKDKRPKAVIGVCCFNEALLAFDMLKGTGVVAQASLLKKDGCKDTILNLEDLEKRLSLVEEKPKKKKSN
ncbi:MAG: DUF116 domain-containing protein [Candidatus ainarchaeum sp.]|nr:DUF116 domain-containing protein [Candidatus ainarchaeum sp.]